MNADSHITLGIVVGAGLHYVSGVDYEPLHYLFYYSSVVVGSLLPDLDHRNSKISRKLKPISWVVGKFGHRKLTHSLLGLYLVCELLWGIYPPVFDGLIVGYMSHLIGDMMTVRGVPLLYPNPKRYRLLPLRLIRSLRKPN